MGFEMFSVRLSGNYSHSEIRNRLERKKRLNESHLKSRDITVDLIKNAHVKSLPELAKMLGTSKSQITRRLQELGIEKRRVFRPYQNHIQNACLILNIETGIYYPNNSEAARSKGHNIRTFQQHISERGHFNNIFIKVA